MPLTAVLLLFELTHDYFIIIPTLASVGISYWVASFPLPALARPLRPLLHAAALLLPQRLRPPALQLPGGAAGKLREAAAQLAQDVAAAERGTALGAPAQPMRNGRGSLAAAEEPDQPAASALIGDLASIGIAPSAAAQRNGSGVRRRGGRPGSVVATLGAGHAASVRFSAPAQAANGAGQAGQRAIGSLPIAGRRDEVADLTVLCALRQACVMLPVDTTLAESLEVRLTALTAENCDALMRNTACSLLDHPSDEFRGMQMLSGAVLAAGHGRGRRVHCAGDRRCRCGRGAADARICD